MPKRGKRSTSSPEKYKRKRKSNNEDYEYVSDDEKLYGGQDEPDPDSREYFYDDIDEFHAKRDKILIDGGVQEDNKYVESDEEEVLALDSSDSDDDEIRQLKAQLRKVNQLRKKSALGSDLEDNADEEDEEDSEKGLPDSRAWGQKRRKYYGEEDLVLSDIEDEEGDAALEEQEALKLQKQMAEQMDDQDFGLDVFKVPEQEKEPMGKEEKIVKDLSKLSKREKLQLLKKESPELLTLIEEFKEKLTEVQERLEPLRMLIQEKQITGKAADYIHTKFRLNLNYCINIMFYLMLKAKQVPVHNHPVIKRLLQHRNLLKQLESLDIQLKDEITDILSRLSAGEDVIFGSEDTSTRLDKNKFVRRKTTKGEKVKEGKKKLSNMVSYSEEEISDNLYEDGDNPKPKVKKSKSDGQYETKDEKAALDYYKMMRSKGREEDNDDDNDEDEGDDMDAQADEEEDETEETVDGKRAINYQIEKNKGLTARKKKELRNPRVKHRMKFKKAKIRRKGQIREVRTEMHRYGGEISGIRAGIKRGIKLK